MQMMPNMSCPHRVASDAVARVSSVVDAVVISVPNVLFSGFAAAILQRFSVHCRRKAGMDHTTRLWATPVSETHQGCASVGAQDRAHASQSNPILLQTLLLYF